MYIWVYWHYYHTIFIELVIIFEFTIHKACKTPGNIIFLDVSFFSQLFLINKGLFSPTQGFPFNTAAMGFKNIEA